MTDTKTLADFGWTAHFQSQLDESELQTHMPVRVVAVHRTGLDVAGPQHTGRVPPLPSRDGDETMAATVGDWLLLDQHLRPRRVLARTSLFKRRAAGTEVRLQLIAANIDTLFIVSSCNADFSPARLERYLAVAREAQVSPVVVLTKADLTDDTGSLVAKAAKLMPGLMVEAIDARAPEEARRLMPWCGRGQTVAVMGSSGVGKSTLLNTLAGESRQATSAIRGDDTGKHTTTARSLHRLPSGAWLLDTPGMRELQITNVEAALEDVFAEVATLAASCRFSDCTHESEPGCAVQAAIAAGEMEEERLRRYRKLKREDLYNSETIAEAHARVRRFHRRVRAAARARRDRDKL
jgi:ribosome biogenesis GTPase